MIGGNFTLGTTTFKMKGNKSIWNMNLLHLGLLSNPWQRTFFTHENKNRKYSHYKVIAMVSYDFIIYEAPQFLLFCWIHWSNRRGVNKRCLLENVLVVSRFNVQYHFVLMGWEEVQLTPKSYTVYYTIQLIILSIWMSIILCNIFLYTL